MYLKRPENEKIKDAEMKKNQQNWLLLIYVDKAKFYSFLSYFVFILRLFHGCLIYFSFWDSAQSNKIWNTS